MPILCGHAVKVAELFVGTGEEVHTADSLVTAAQILDGDPAETLVVIGPETPTSEALAFAARLRLSRPALGVILVRERVDVELLSRALQSGVREVVPAGDYNALQSACRRSREVSRRMLSPLSVEETQPAVDGQIITVFAAKGGCGKTTVAVNLGVVLARGTGRRVCVVDLDLAFGDVAISVQLDPVRTIVDAMPMAGHLDITGAASLLTRYRPGLEMLLAPVTPGDADKVSAALVGELLTVLRGMFDFVVIDTPAQFSEHVLTAMDASAHHVLLTTPDVSALKNLRVTLDMLDLLSYPRQIRSVLLNRSDSKVGLSLEDVERAVRCPIAAFVPSSRAVPISINKGTPITMSSAGHPVSQSLLQFAQARLLGGPAAGRAPLSLARGRRRTS
ncbi:MAG TPA: AAA family ATPase [Streptosporangiaceae bacterium]|jgi:pilus assembly protein CpaE|nr:AAA family ATPase [Streptosporangiaceae bacterium]